MDLARITVDCISVRKVALLSNLSCCLGKKKMKGKKYTQVCADMMLDSSRSTDTIQTFMLYEALKHHQYGTGLDMSL